MGLLGNVLGSLISDLPQTVEGCDREIAKYEKWIIGSNSASKKKEYKQRLVDLKAQRKKLKAKK